jgi:hypothetical protein
LAPMFVGRRGHYRLHIIQGPAIDENGTHFSIKRALKHDRIALTLQYEAG